MKKYISLIFIALGLAASAQGAYDFRLAPTTVSPAVKAAIEQNVSNLFTAINAAATTGGDINFSGIDLTQDAKQSIVMTWENVHFTTAQDQYVGQLLKEKNSNGSLRGLQVRNQQVDMKPIDDTYEGPMAQEIVLDFTPTGRISDFNFAMENTQYLTLLRDGARLGDAANRMQIINWCEKLRNAYCQKDIRMLDDLFSDDALIITGRVVTERRRSDIALANPTRVEYVKQNKQQYLSRLKMVFDRQNRGGYVNVKFDDYRVVRHASKPNYYGVTLRQQWHTKGYSDEGIVFLIWDFNDEDHPKIHVRTWQPLQDTPFTMGDFKLPDPAEKASFTLDRN